MFAPKLSKPQNKASGSSTDGRGYDRPMRAGHGFDRDQAAEARLPQRTIGDQALPGRSTQQPSIVDQEISPKGRSISRERGGFSFSFRNIPVFRTKAASKPQQSLSPPPMEYAGVIQAKLEVGAVDDPLEREADRIADHVMGMSDTAFMAPPVGMAGGISGLQRKPRVPRTSSPGFSSPDAGATAPPIVNEVLRSPGRSLDAATQSFMESRFASDFSDVRVHMDSRAARSAAAVHARAYTVGNNVVFGAGNFAPNSHEGKRLIAHELTHVLQQGATRPLSIGAGERPSSTELTGHSREANAVLRREPANDTRPLKISTDASEFHADEAKGSKTTYYRGEYLEVQGEHGPEREEVYWVKFNVDEKGVMRGSVRTVSADKKFRSGQLRFKDEFSKALETFKKNGVDVKEFEADWSYMSPDEMSENLRVFQQGVKGGDTREGAASKTPTGKVVTKAGFKVADVKDVAEPQEHLADEKGTFPRVKARFVRTTGQETGGTSGGNGGPKPTGKTTGTPVTPVDTKSGAPPQVKSQGGAKPPAATDVDSGGTGTKVSPKVKGQGGVNGPTGTDVEPEAVGKSGTTPTPKNTVQEPPSGGLSGSRAFAISVGATVVTIGLEFLAAYFKAKYDAASAKRQTEAFLALATKKINANPDEAVKKMLANPEGTVYAWVHLSSTTISSLGTDPFSGDPTLHTSSPLFDLGPIEYVTGPVPQELASSLPKIGGGGLAPTVTRDIIIDLALTTPPFEELVAYAKKRSLPLDDVYAYALHKFQAAASANVSVLETRVQLLQTWQTNNETWKVLDAAYKKAEKAKDIKQQVAIFHQLSAIDQAQLSITAQLNNIEKKMQQAEADVNYWQRIVDMLRPTKP